MSYTITFWSKPYLAVAGKTTANKETAAEAWALVQGLMRSDETVEIRFHGSLMGWETLRMLAEQESR